MEPPLQERKDSTALNVCRFSSVMSTAATMSAAVAHLMEMPAKMEYEPSLYVRLHRTLYPRSEERLDRRRRAPSRRQPRWPGSADDSLAVDLD